MKVVIVFDTVHGSTGEVAEAIAEEVRSGGDEAEVVDLRASMPLDLSGDLMFVGSPTRAGRMTKRTAEFLRDFVSGPWRGRRIVAFDTVGPLSKDPEKRREALRRIGNTTRSAAGTIQAAVERRGLTPAPEQMHLPVTGLWGPLAPDARDMARELARKHLDDARRELQENVQLA
jgi:flavorubredoxin